jgi:hypothetical protein
VWPDLFDREGTRLVNEKTRQPLQNLHKGWPAEARDLIEELCTKKLSHHRAVKAARHGTRPRANFLDVEAVRQACLTLAERLLVHLDALNEVGWSFSFFMCFLIFV